MFPTSFKFAIPTFFILIALKYKQTKSYFERLRWQQLLTLHRLLKENSSCFHCYSNDKKTLCFLTWIIFDRLSKENAIKKVFSRSVCQIFLKGFILIYLETILFKLLSIFNDIKNIFCILKVQ